MESKEYFEKVMQDYNQHRNGRSLRKYCKDEAIDYDWVIKFKKTYPVRSTAKEEPTESSVPLAVTEDPVPALEWAVEHLVLRSPKSDVLEIKSTSLIVVAELLHKISVSTQCLSPHLEFVQFVFKISEKLDYLHFLL